MDITTWAPWCIAAGACVVHWMTGKKDKKAHVISALISVFTVVYSVITHQYGFIAISVMNVSFCVRNYALWKKDDEEAQRIAGGEGRDMADG